MKYRYHFFVVALLLTTTGCSLLSRLTEEQNERLAGSLELEIETELIGLWEGGTIKLFVDLENDRWWQSWWASEQREPQSCVYTHQKKKLHLVLTSEENIQSPQVSPSVQKFTITIDGKFRKRKKNIVFGPFKGEAVGRDINWPRDTAYNIEYENVRVRWSGRAVGRCILSDGIVGRLHVIRR